MRLDPEIAAHYTSVSERQRLGPWSLERVRTRELLGRYLPPPPAVVLVSSRARSDYGSLVDASRAVGFLTKADLNGAALARVLNPPCAG